MSAADNNNNDNNNVPDVCANCGKGEESSISLKACTACKLVKYCNRECQIAHRSQHKRECKKRAAELHDEALFKEVEPVDCPICMLRMPTLISGSKYMSCCGKEICCGCIHAPRYDDKGNVVADTCPFCRILPPKTDKDAIERLIERVELNDPEAMNTLGLYYAQGDEGRYGLPKDYEKTLELWHQAGELGHAGSYFNISQMYMSGEGVELDKKKAMYYCELAAMRGHVEARHNFGIFEGQAGKVQRTLKHLMYAVKSGGNNSLRTIRKMVTNGHATKDDYTKALRSYQVYLDEIKSDQRDKAAAENEDCKYY